MSRANIHDIKNNFGQSLISVHTNLSGAATLAVPDAEHSLRVFKIICVAPTDMAAAQTVQITDGTGAALHTFAVPTSGESVLDLGSRFLTFADSVNFTGATENVHVTVMYDVRPDRN